MTTLQRLTLIIGLSFSMLGHGASTGLVLDKAWIRATPPNARVAGAFLTIENNGNSADRLLSVRTDAAMRVEMHEMKMQGEMMQMRELKDALVLPAKQAVTLQPGGIHLMLIEPKQPIAEGQLVSLILRFEKAGERTVQFIGRKSAPTSSNPELP